MTFTLRSVGNNELKSSIIKTERIATSDSGSRSFRFNLWSESGSRLKSALYSGSESGREYRPESKSQSCSGYTQRSRSRSRREYMSKSKSQSGFGYAFI